MRAAVDNTLQHGLNISACVILKKNITLNWKLMGEDI